jgi:glycosyltransferase involved in cell wall biosynthesis
MKILMTADTIGGVWTYAIDLAKALEPFGVEIALATMGDPVSPSQRRAAERCANLTLHESTYKLEWMDNPWEDVASAGCWLLDLEQRLRPDVIHLNGYAHGALPFSAPIVIVAHSCCLSWWQAVKHEPAPREWARYREKVSRGIHEADVVIAPTLAMLDAVERHYGTPRSKRVIFNGRDRSIYRAAEKESFILTAGRLWDEAKNISSLQTIAGDVSWPICVAGEQHHPDGSSQQIGNDLLALGKLEPRALADWYARADIYALPARYEPFGLSALEAALSECALVLGDIPSLREVWGDAAFYASPDDPDELRAQLTTLIDHPPLRRTLARRGAIRAAQYTLGRMGRAYVAVYQQLARRRALTDALRPFDPLTLGTGADSCGL